MFIGNPDLVIPVKKVLAGPGNCSWYRRFG
jgi:hypothetical protein